MIEGLPFVFLEADETDSYFDNDSGSRDNLNNTDPDLMPAQSAQEYDTAYEQFDRYSGILDDFEQLESDHGRLQEEHRRLLHDELSQDFISSGESAMRYGMPLLESLHEAIVQPPAKPQSIREALTESRQESLPKRPFERLVARVCSGEVKRNNVG